MLLVILDSFTVVQDLSAGSDQGQQMLSEMLAKFNRFTDLEEEEDLMKEY